MAKVMLVEDDNNLREIYEARLQAEGYTIVSAKDGEEALVVAKAELPDLIISDVMMPKISGFEMLDILRNTEGLKDVKVIMLTALGQTDDQQRADKLGADKYLVKSQVTLEDIVEVARQLLGGAATAAAPEAPATSPAAAETPVAVAPAPEPAAAAESTSTPEPQAAASAPQKIEVSKASEAPAPTPAPSQPVDPPNNGIESFVAGATTEAPAPTAAPAPAAQPASSPATPATTDDTTVSTDDTAMSDAVNDLVTSTHAQPAEPTAGPLQVTESPPAPASTESAGGTKKVITPIDSQPKPDINALLAAEEAKEAAAAAPTTETPTVASPPANDKPADPNSIAL